MPFIQLISPLLYAPPISILLQALVNQYLLDSYYVTLVLDEPIDFNANISFTYMTPSNGSVKDLTNQLLEVSEKGCSDYVVCMSDPQKFMSAFDRTVLSGNTRKSDRKIIILPYSSESEYANQSLELSSMKESQFVANLLVILHRTKEAETDCDIYDFVTHEFISLDHDRPLYLDQWNSCTQKFDKNVNLFPHDLKNLNGRIVRVATFTYKPYTLVELDTALEPSQRDGIEIRLCDEFCLWVNCSIEIMVEKVDMWGEIFENGSGVGIIGAVAMDRADMGAAALYSWYNEYTHLDFSAPVIRAVANCLVPKPRLVVSWQMPLMPFTSTIWYAVGLCFIFTSIGLIVAGRCSTKNVFLTVFGTMIAQSQRDDVGWRVRGITGGLLIGSLIIISAYGAGLASTFTVPRYEKPIDTIQDLVDSKLDWGSLHSAWIFSLILSDEPLLKQLLKRFHIYPVEELKRRSFERNLVYPVEKLQGGTVAVSDFIPNKAVPGFKLMLEDLYYDYGVVMMRKSSIYTERISELIGRLHQSGIIVAWESQVSQKYLDFEVTHEFQSSHTNVDTGFTSLSLRHVVGIYIIYFTGVTIATLIFIGEWIAGKRGRVQELQDLNNI